MPQQYDARPPTCPPWCELGHGTHTGEDDHVHIGGQLCVRNTLMRLCSTIDPATGEQDGPYVLMGTQEFTIDEVGELIAALTALAERAGRSERASRSGRASRAERAGRAGRASRAERAEQRIPNPREAV